MRRMCGHILELVADRQDSWIVVEHIECRLIDDHRPRIRPLCHSNNKFYTTEGSLSLGSAFSAHFQHWLLTVFPMPCFGSHWKTVRKCFDLAVVHQLIVEMSEGLV